MRRTVRTKVAVLSSFASIARATPPTSTATKGLSYPAKRRSPPKPTTFCG